MKSLVIGAGEVGKAIFDIIKDTHESYIRDLEDFECEGVEVMHICYPDHIGFIETVKRYVKKYQPKLTLIHSSVSVGTTEKCGLHMVYSPVRGRHPNLSKEIRVYAKVIATPHLKDMAMAEKYLTACGLQVMPCFDPQAMELMKLLSNIHMGLEIAWRQEVEGILDYFSVNPKHYEMWEKTYAEGYQVLGQQSLMRPQMRPDPIGGHCILPCTEILNSQYPSEIFRFILEKNEQTKSKGGVSRDLSRV